jgi:AcrR family transcriptional regulator
MTETTRPTTRTAEATRDRILLAAAHILSQRGLAQTRLSEIAARAEVRSPALYYHFESRDDLIAEVLRMGQQRVRSHVEQAIAAVPTDRPHIDRIAAACRAHVRIQVAMADFAGAVSRNAAHATGPLHEELHLESERYHDVWRSLIAAATDAGELRPGLDPSSARMLAIGSLNWITEWFPAGGDIDLLVEQSVSLVTQGLVKES